MDLASLTPLTGGWSGETFVAEVAGERQVVRIHARNPIRAEVDAALLRLVRGLVPVAEVLEVRAPTDDLPALLVTSFEPGERGDRVLPGLDDAGLATLGHHMGALVATLGGMPTLEAGDFLDAGLRIEPWQLPDGLPGFVEEHGPRHWPAEKLQALVGLARRAQDLLDTVGRTCLVHSDVNPKNVLVDPDTLRVTALLDWEFSHAGHPFTDLGNVLRFERRPAYVDAVLEAYAERRGTPPGEALDLARAADLWALVELAARRGENPVADAADDLLHGIVEADDAGWTPPTRPA